MRTRQLLSFLLFLLSVGFLVFSWKAKRIVPIPDAKTVLSVEKGKLYPFAWINGIDCTTLKAGCFRVENITSESITVAFERFTVKNSTVQPIGLSTRRSITKNGTQEVLYTIEKDSQGQQWVYARTSPSLLSGTEIEFLRYPAFVTKKAKIYREMTLDFATKTLNEAMLISAEEPVTLLTSGAVEKAIPGSSLSKLDVNGKRPQFSHPNITILNLPEGKTEIETEISWQDEKSTLCPWSLYEGRKMSLPLETELTVKNAESKQLSISLSSFGIPEQVWQENRVILEVEPTPDSTQEQSLSKTLRFSAAKELTVKIKPVILYEGASFPVVICVRQSA